MAGKTDPAIIGKSPRSPSRMQQRCRVLDAAAAIYGVPFSADSLEQSYTHGSETSITLSDGRCSAPSASPKVLGVQVDSKRSLVAAISAREAATRVWFQHRKWLTCRRVWVHHRLWHLCAMASAALPPKSWRAEVIAHAPFAMGFMHRV